jgi:siroheme synthase-like protein
MDLAVNLRIGGRQCVVVGAGPVATRKVRALLRSGARVRWVGPGARRLQLKKTYQQIEPRGFRNEDLDGAFLVVAATDDRNLQRKLARLCARRKILINVADVPELCDLTFPSVLRRGLLQIAISTQGRAPGVSRAIRLELRKWFPPGVARFVRQLGEFRAGLKRREASPARRVARARRVVSAWRLNGLRAAQREMSADR